MALRTLAEWRGLSSDSKCFLEAEPGNLLDSKRSEPGILFLSLPIGRFFSIVPAQTILICGTAKINAYRNLE